MPESEMMQVSDTPVLISALLPIILVSVVISTITYSLAREKGRNVKLWALLGFIPIINYFFLFYSIGAANLRLEEKIDKLLKTVK